VVNNKDGDSIIHKEHISTVGSSRTAISHVLCNVKDENCCQQKIQAKIVEENYPLQKMQLHFYNSSICINACISHPFGNIRNISYGNHFSYNCILCCEFSGRLCSQKSHRTMEKKLSLNLKNIFYIFNYLEFTLSALDSKALLFLY